jgi:hypothetical protein
MHDTDFEPATMTRDQAARYLSLKPSTLAKWAAEDRGPPFVKLHAHARNGGIRYIRSDLDTWLRAGAPTDRRGARPASWPAGGYGSTDRRRDPAGRFARVSPSP